MMDKARFLALLTAILDTTRALAAIGESVTDDNMACALRKIDSAIEELQGAAFELEPPSDEDDEDE